MLPHCTTAKRIWRSRNLRRRPIRLSQCWSALSIGIPYIDIAIFAVPFIPAGNYPYKNPKRGAMILTWNAVFRKRIPASPAILELPTIAESGFPGFEVTVWYGLLAPAGTPATIVRNLPLETAKTLAHPDLH